MDNASKALIMAGGILIAVMVISIALYVYTSAQSVANEANKQMEASAIASYNRYYESFGASGVEIWGIDALNICNKVEDDNDRHTSIYEINLSYDSTVDSMKAPDGASRMKDPNYKYIYTYKDNNGDGYIDTISITKKG